MLSIASTLLSSYAISAASAMQLSNLGFIQLFKLTPQFLTIAGGKSQNCAYRYRYKFIISTLCLAISTAQNSYISQIKSSPIPHNSNFKPSTPTSNPYSTTSLLTPRQKTSSPVSQRSYSMSYRNPSILPTHTANPTPQNCSLLPSLSPLQFQRKLWKVNTSLCCSSHSSLLPPIIPFLILLISAFLQATSLQRVFHSYIFPS